jgi:hypothetical protein
VHGRLRRISENAAAIDLPPERSRTLGALLLFALEFESSSRRGSGFGHFHDRAAASDLRHGSLSTPRRFDLCHRMHNLSLCNQYEDFMMFQMKMS